MTLSYYSMEYCLILRHALKAESPPSSWETDAGDVPRRVFRKLTRDVFQATNFGTPERMFEAFGTCLFEASYKMTDLVEERTFDVNRTVLSAHQPDVHDSIADLLPRQNCSLEGLDRTPLIP